MFGVCVNVAGLAPHPDGRPIGLQIVTLFRHDALDRMVAALASTV